MSGSVLHNKLDLNSKLIYTPYKNIKIRAKKGMSTYGEQIVNYKPWKKLKEKKGKMQNFRLI